MHKNLRLLFKGIVIIFAIIGFVLTFGYAAMNLKLTNTLGVIDNQNESFRNNLNKEKTYTVFPLAHTPEWNAFKQAVAKDKIMIDNISKVTGVSQRLIITILVPEQMRFFHSNRATFKRAFEPLKILGSQSQFSWGLFGIKDETAKAVEKNLLDTNSVFYIGKEYEHLLDLKTENHEQERFERITDEHNHYYSYLYTALYIKQIETQWQKAGFPIKDKPEIIATLWNLGFTKSKPNNNPKSGGAEIDINGTKYSFGSLAKEFYYSDELIELYP